MQKPAGAEMRFADFVLAEIEEGNYRYSEQFFGESDLFVNGNRPKSKEWKGYSEAPKDRDDWNLFCAWDLFTYRIHLQRGKEEFNIALTKEEKRRFVVFYKAERARWKLEKQQRKLDHAAAEARAAWWP